MRVIIQANDVISLDYELNFVIEISIIFLAFAIIQANDVISLDYRID